MITTTDLTLGVEARMVVHLSLRVWTIQMSGPSINLVITIGRSMGYYCEILLHITAE